MALSDRIVTPLIAPSRGLPCTTARRVYWPWSSIGWRLCDVPLVDRRGFFGASPHQIPQEPPVYPEAFRRLRHFVARRRAGTKIAWSSSHAIKRLPRPHGYAKRCGRGLQTLGTNTPRERAPSFEWPISYVLGIVIPCCLMYLPDRSAYETSPTSSPPKNNTWARPSFA